MPFKIRTADGDRGPFSAEQISGFIDDGKLTPETKILDTETQAVVKAGEVAAGIAAPAGPDFADPAPQIDPFAAPRQDHATNRRAGRSTSKKRGVHGFAKGWLITDLVFCAIRALIAAGTLFVLVSAPQGVSMAQGALEFITGLGIAVCGLIGNSLLLGSKPAGLPLAWANVGFTAASMVVSLYGLSLALGQMPSSGPEVIGFWIGAIFTLLIRVTLLVFYVMAVKKAKEQIAAMT